LLLLPGRADLEEEVIEASRKKNLEICSGTEIRVWWSR